MVDFRFMQAQVYVAIVAEEGSFSRAARRLHTSQSFVTKRISNLERTLGARLFERSTRRLELTEAGRMLLPEVQLALRHTERAWELARYSARIATDPIRIGYSPYVNGAILPVLYELNLAELEAQRTDTTGFPQSQPELASSNTPELVEEVLRGQIQVGLGVQPVQDLDLWVKPVAREAFCICVPKNHGFAQRTSIAVRDLDGQSLFWFPRKLHSAFHDHTVEYVQSTGAHPTLHEIGSTIQAIDAVARGFGLALLPSGASRLSRSGVVFKPIADRFLQIETAIFARRDLLHGGLQDFVMFLASRLQSLKLILR
jgi:DNA-binding transcriptional LysR family regulator